MLYEHTRSKHSGTRYSCNKCEYQGTKQSNLLRHKTSQHECVKYLCNEVSCDAKFTNEWYLKKHHEYSHTGPEYDCNVCEYKTLIFSILIRHKKSRHEGITFSFNQCGFKATHPSSVLRHKRSEH